MTTMFTTVGKLSAKTMSKISLGLSMSAALASAYTEKLRWDDIRDNAKTAFEEMAKETLNK